jgi:dihydroflavonol-4-reductase
MDVTAYGKSKTLAERAARDFMAKDTSGMHYSSVNPGLVLGPALDRDIGTSAQIVQAFLKGKYPGAPNMAIPCVDVRDVALMHRLALETSAPSGGRYLGVAESLWLIEIADALRAGLGDAARKVPKRVLPDWVVKLVSIWDGAARQTVPELGKAMNVDNSLTRRTLGMDFIPAREAAVAMAKSLIELQLV